MRTKLKILCDVDGVVAGLHAEWIRRYNVDWNDNVRTEDVTDWDIRKFVKCGDKIYDYLWQENLYDKVRPIMGSVVGIKYLRQVMNHRVIFVTSGLQPAKIKWLYKKGLILSPIWQSDGDFVIAADKSLISGDIMLDDSVDNLTKFTGEHKILFDAPYNRTDRSFRRVNNMQEFVRFVKEL